MITFKRKQKQNMITFKQKQKQNLITVKQKQKENMITFTKISPYYEGVKMSTKC